MHVPHDFAFCLHWGCCRHAKKLIKFNRDLGRDSSELLKLPQDSFTVPPDTPTESQAATPAKQDAQSSSSTVFPYAATPIHQPASAALEPGSHEQVTTANGNTVSMLDTLHDGRQMLSDDTARTQLPVSSQSLMRPPSRRSEETRRSFTAQRSLQGHERRVFADSATILSFADVRGSIDVPDDD